MTRRACALGSSKLHVSFICIRIFLFFGANHNTAKSIAMGNKKKSRKAAAPVSELPPPLQTDVDDDGLLDELVAQLGSEDGAVQENAATIIQELDQTNKAEEAESKSSKKDSRARFEARKVRCRSQT